MVRSLEVLLVVSEMEKGEVSGEKGVHFGEFGELTKSGNGRSDNKFVGVIFQDVAGVGREKLFAGSDDSPLAG